jgi:aspartyl/asparaginyl-tRNA synthetase
VKIRKSLIASAMVGALAFVGSNAVADPLEDLHKTEGQIHKSGAKSQIKINNLYEQGQILVGEYRAIVDETENLKVYNDYVNGLVKSQQAEIDSLNGQIQEIENTKKNVVPLMYKMIETLETFVKADIPIKQADRLERVEKLRENMSRSDITVSERYRQVLEAYQIEKDFGSLVSAWQGTLNVEGRDRTVDFVNVGRVAFLAQSLDMKSAWVWNNQSRDWQKLDDAYLRSLTLTIRVARQQSAPSLVKLPIFAAE